MDMRFGISHVAMTESAEDYYRRILYIPLLDSISAQFYEHFLFHKNTAMRINALLQTPPLTA